MWVSSLLSITYVRWVWKLDSGDALFHLVISFNVLLLIYQAYWSGKYYPGYAWIIVDNFAQWDWWNIDSNGVHESINCTQSQFETVLNYSITVTPVPADYKEENGVNMKVICTNYPLIQHQV